MGYKIIIIFSAIIKVSRSSLLFNETHQIVHFHLIMSVFCVLINIKWWARGWVKNGLENPIGLKKE